MLPSKNKTPATAGVCRSDRRASIGDRCSGSQVFIQEFLRDDITVGVVVFLEEPVALFRLRQVLARLAGLFQRVVHLSRVLDGYALVVFAVDDQYRRIEFVDMIDGGVRGDIG